MNTTIPRARNSFGLWYAMVGSPFVWAAHFMLVWAITEIGCRIGLANARVLGIYTLHALTLLSSLVSLVLIFLSGYSAYRTLLYLRGTDRRDEAPIERTRFMSTMGIMFSVLFAVVVIYMLVPLLVLPVCDI